MHIHIHIHRHVYVHMYMHMYMRMYACVYAYVYPLVQLYKYTYTSYVYINIHTGFRVQVHVQALVYVELKNLQEALHCNGIRKSTTDTVRAVAIAFIPVGGLGNGFLQR